MSCAIRLAYCYFWTSIPQSRKVPLTLAALLDLNNHFSLIFPTSVISPKKTVLLITTMHLVSCPGLPVSFALGVGPFPVLLDIS